MAIARIWIDDGDLSDRRPKGRLRHRASVKRHALWPLIHVRNSHVKALREAEPTAIGGGHLHLQRRRVFVVERDTRFQPQRAVFDLKAVVRDGEDVAVARIRINDADLPNDRAGRIFRYRPNAGREHDIVDQRAKPIAFARRLTKLEHILARPFHLERKRLPCRGFGIDGLH